MRTVERIEAVEVDITRLEVDALVNAANRTLLGGGGVDGAIHRAAGPDLLAKCATLGGCATGAAKITPGYRLAAKHVIHTVGPVYRGGRRKEAELLASCYRRSLELAAKNACSTVAFPAISTGAYGYPFDDASSIALHTTIAFLEKNTLPAQVIFVLFGKEDYERFQAILMSVTANED